MKRRKKKALVTASSWTNGKTRTDDLAAIKFAADCSAQIEVTNDDTKQSNWVDESSEKNLLGTIRARPSSSNNEPVNDGTYKCASAYQSFIQKNPDAPSRQVGLVRAPTNIRTITVTDFAPDVCKDYKQTGFCGFLVIAVSSSMHEKITSRGGN